VSFRSGRAGWPHRRLLRGDILWKPAASHSPKVTDRSTASEGHGSADRSYNSIGDGVDGRIDGNRNSIPPSDDCVHKASEPILGRSSSPPKWHRAALREVSRTASPLLGLRLSPTTPRSRLRKFFASQSSSTARRPSLDYLERSDHDSNPICGSRPWARLRPMPASRAVRCRRPQSAAWWGVKMPELLSRLVSAPSLPSTIPGPFLSVPARQHEKAAHVDHEERQQAYEGWEEEVDHLDSPRSSGVSPELRIARTTLPESDLKWDSTGLADVGALTGPGRSRKAVLGLPARFWPSAPKGRRWASSASNRLPQWLPKAPSPKNSNGESRIEDCDRQGVCQPWWIDDYLGRKAPGSPADCPGQLHRREGGFDPDAEPETRSRHVTHSGVIP